MSKIETRGLVGVIDGYSLFRTQKAWRIEGYEWHGEQDASREFAHHRLGVRAETLQQTLNRFIGRASTIGAVCERGCHGLTRTQAAAIAAKLESVAEVISAIESGEELPDLVVKVTWTSSGIQWQLSVSWGDCYASAFANTSGASTDGLVGQWKARLSLPPVVASAIDWDSIDYPDPRRSLVGLAIHRKMELIRKSDGQRVRVEGEKTTWTQGHPSFGSGRSVGLTRVTIGGIDYDYADAINAHDPA